MTTNTMQNELFEYEINDNGKITISSYIGDNADVVIPAEIEGKPVTEIGVEVFGVVVINYILLIFHTE